MALHGARYDLNQDGKIDANDQIDGEYVYDAHTQQ
jgi:hypothetical protein